MAGDLVQGTVILSAYHLSKMNAQLREENDALWKSNEEMMDQLYGYKLQGSEKPNPAIFDPKKVWQTLKNFGNPLYLSRFFFL